jgi:DNA-binding SARP family transcriptional activator/tetratricopeptide (TPR) repeat protein
MSETSGADPGLQPGMRVTLLGPVGVASAGMTVHLGGPKQRAVLALLALDVGRVVSADRLILQLWREEPPAQAMMALQSYVSRLRRVLAAVRPTGSSPVIVTRAPGWVLELPPDSVDVTQFAALVTRGRALLASAEPADAVKHLRSALALWSGPAMDDLRMSGFAVAERTRLEQLRMDATESLFEAELAAGNWPAVVEGAERFTEENPFRERAWLVLMLAMYRSGRQADALAVAGRLRALLTDELGLDPSPEVRDLETRILRQDPALDASRRSDLLLAPADEPQPPGRAAAVDRQIPVQAAVPDGQVGDLESPRELIVGRDDVLATAEEVLIQGAQGRGGVLLVEGPAGIGKSTVLRAVTELTRLSGGVAVHGAGVVGAAGTPAFWPWVQITRELELEFPGLVRGTAAAALAAIDPALDTGGPPHGDRGDPGLSRTRLYRAVVDLLTSARRQRPVTVVLDDAQWVDEETAGLLAAAVPELTGRGVVFTLAFRSEDSSGGPDALALVRGLRRDAVLRLELRALGLAEVDEVVRRMNGSEPKPGVSRAIWTRTMGNPYFVAELVRLLMSEDRLHPEGVYDALPTEVREVLRRRLGRLPDASVAVLVVAALVGRPVDVALLVRVTGMSEEAVLVACEGAILTGLLVDEQARPGSFVLKHDLVRQTVVESVPSARRLRLHARIGEAMQQDVDRLPERVLEVAEHLRLAAPLIGPAPAIPFLIAATDDALSRMALRQAERILAGALDLAGKLPEGEQRTTVERQALGRLGVVRIYSKGPVGVESSGLLASLAPGVVPVLDPMDPTDWWAAMTMSVALGEYDSMVARARAALRPDLTPALEAMVRLELGLALFQLGRFDGAEPELRAAQTLLTGGAASGSVVMTISGDAAEVLLGMMAHFRGDERAADEHLLQAVTNAGDAFPRRVVATFGNGWLAASRGDAPACAAHALACSRIGTEMEYPAYVSMGEILSGWAAALLGDAAGPRAADDAYGRYVADGTRLNTTLFLMLRAEAHDRYGRRDHARELVDQARRVALETGERALSPRLMALADELAGTGPAR